MTLENRLAYLGRSFEGPVSSTLVLTNTPTEELFHAVPSYMSPSADA